MNTTSSQIRKNTVIQKIVNINKVVRLVCSHHACIFVSLEKNLKLSVPNFSAN
jgi:hypothetical protein